jgi:aromatic O-demethylase, cytochrome P450 subunit
MTRIATDVVVDVPMSELEADPYPRYAQMRRATPICWVPETGRLWVTTWDLCDEAGNNHAVFGPTQDVHHRVYGAPNVMALSGQEHLDHRAPLNACFRPGAVRGYADSILRATAARYVDAISERGAADLSADVLEPLSVRAIGDVMGFRDVDDATLTRWFHTLGELLVDLARTPRIVAEASETKRELVRYLEARAAHADGSTIDHMLAAGLPVEDLLADLGVMIVGGLQEPAHGTANTMLGLLTHPDQARAVAQDPRTWAGRAVHEGLRWIAPFNMTEKLTTEDVLLGGVLIPAGTEIALVIGSANRDERRFERPDEFDIGRDRQTQVAFGYGPHLCIGHYVARQLAQVSVEELLRRLPGLRLDPDDEPWVHGWQVRAAKRLPVVWDA